MCLNVLLFNGLDVLLLYQIVNDDLGTLLDTLAIIVLQVDLGLFWSLVWGRNAGEFLDDAFSGLFIQTLGVSLFGHVHRNVNVDLHKGKVVAFVQFSGHLSVLDVRADERS